jgi:hypothetical protein
VTQDIGAWIECRQIDTEAIAKDAAEYILGAFSFSTLLGPENLRARLTMVARQAAWQGALAGYRLGQSMRPNHPGEAA